MKSNVVLLLMVVSIALASPLSAGQIQVGAIGSPYGAHQTGIGGEFTLNGLNGWLDLSGYVGGTTKGLSGIMSFQTFCLEMSEHISPYSATYEAQLGPNAIFGGVNATGDPVSVGTGWLYRQFATTTWDAGLTYDYISPGRSGSASSSAHLFQQAIWWLEGEASVSYNNLNPYMAASVTKFGGQNEARADGGTAYNVYAINLWTGSNPFVNRAQDQLFYQAPAIPPASVPDGGATAILLGISLCGLFAVSRCYAVRVPSPYKP